MSRARIGVIAAIVVAATVVSVGANAAQKASSSTRPGWGYGDKNHVHTGPPGQSVHAATVR